MTVNIHEAKTNLSKLIEKVEAGEEVIIARAGKPVARLLPIEQPMPARRVPGSASGQIWVADDFNDPLPPEIQRYFE